MTAFDTVVVSGELLSGHYLAEQLGRRVREQRAVWADQEQHGKTTARSGLLAAARGVVGDLVRARELQGDRGVQLLERLYGDVRAALGLASQVTTWTARRAGSAWEVPAVVHASPTGVHLLVLQAGDAATVEDVLDGRGAGRLLSPVERVEGTGGAQRLVATADAVSAVFLAEDPPALVLVQAGAWLLVAERTRWAEGRWLAVDLATVCERRDARARRG